MDEPETDKRLKTGGGKGKEQIEALQTAKVRPSKHPLYKHERMKGAP